MVYLGTLKGLTTKRAREQALALLERVELDEHADKKAKELSKGMQQKVQFAVTVMHEPDLIIIDEPFSGLDPVNTLLIKDLILEMKERGTAIIMSTHQMYQIEEMADRLLMISRGKQALYGPVDDVRKQYALHAVVVEGEGEWASLPGITHVENDPNRRDARLLFMAPDVTSNDILSAVAANPSISVERFQQAIPSLNDIFIQVADDDPDIVRNGAKSPSASGMREVTNA